MSSFRKFFKKVTKVVSGVGKTVLPAVPVILGGAIGGLVGPAIGAAAGTSVKVGAQVASSLTAPPAPTSPPQPATTLGGDMSLLGDIGRAIAPGVGQIFGGATGMAIGQEISRISAANRASLTVSPVTGGVQPAAFPALGAIAGVIGRGAGIAVGAVTLGARTVFRSASIYCRRHPAWCAQIGGTAAIASMIQSGQLPPIRRRRARGISPSEFRGFRKVHKVLSGFCAPRMRVRTKRN